jgi:N-acetylmuramoyl-L-alanine amidase
MKHRFAGKLILYLILTIMAVDADFLLVAAGETPLLLKVAWVYLAATEAISVLENLRDAGVEQASGLLDFLRSRLSVLLDRFKTKLRCIVMIKVFINPGHAPGGYPDPGAAGPSGLRESDVAADVAAQVVNYLNCAGCQAIAYQSDSLQDICNQANNWDADLIVSIHCNSVSSAAATGMEIWTSRGQTRADRQATLIMHKWPVNFQLCRFEVIGQMVMLIRKPVCMY